LLGNDGALEGSTRQTSLCKAATQQWEAALGEAVRFGNELGASLGTRSLSTVSDSLREEQGEQLGDPVRTNAGVEVGAELGPALVLVLDAPLGSSFRRYRKAPHRRCTLRQYSAIP
jgi:hypothetical protein